MAPFEEVDESTSQSQVAQFNSAVNWARDLPDLLDGQGRYDRPLHQFAMVVASFADWKTGKNCRPGSATLERIMRLSDVSIRDLWRRGVDQGLWIDTGLKKHGVTVWNLQLDADLSSKEFLIDDKRAARREKDRERQAKRRAKLNESRKPVTKDLSRKPAADVTEARCVTSRKPVTVVTHQTSGDQPFVPAKVDQPGDYPSLAAAPPNESGNPSINHPPKTRPQSATSTVDSEPDQPVMLNFMTDLDRKTDERLAKQTATVAKRSGNPHRDAVLAKKDAKREAFVEDWAETDKQTHQYDLDAGPTWTAFVAEFEARKKREGLDWHIQPWVATKIKATIAECLVKGYRYAGIHEVTNVMVDCARRADKPYLDITVSTWLASNGMVDWETKKWKGHLGSGYSIAEREEEFGTQMVDSQDGGTWSLSPLAKKDEAEEKAFRAEHGMGRDEARYEAKRAESARKLEERAAAEEAEEEARRLARLQHEAERPQREAEAAAQAKMFEEYRARAAAPVHIPVQRSTFNRGGAQAAKIEQDEAAKVKQSEQSKATSQALRERLHAIRVKRETEEAVVSVPRSPARRKRVTSSAGPTEQELRNQAGAAQAVAEAEEALARLAADGWNYQKPEPRKARVA